jgi:lysozyme family protein
MNPDFNIAYNKTKTSEGEYSNDPNDAGGETWKGISRIKNPTWAGWSIIDKIKTSVAKNELILALNKNEELTFLVNAFYKQNHWDSLNLDYVLYQEIADELFDTGVNQGPATSGKYFQQSLNFLNSNQKYYKNIDEDGVIGQGTLTALKAYFNIPGRLESDKLKVLLKVLNGIQFCKYKDICVKNETQEVFFYGWVLNRID